MLNYYSKKQFFNKSFYDSCIQNTMQYIRNFTKDIKKNTYTQTITYNSFDNKLYKKNISPIYLFLKDGIVSIIPNNLYEEQPNPDPKDPYNFKYIIYFISVSSLTYYYYYYLLKEK